ncbi:hypothetical protein AB0I22_33220 [Streptomyces sp. NPDC050610]|uniref:hypothetical protein n=1 Tax=Streptomyces sp. NPDC050610 TaxID=3157097 RepID=UPI00342C2A26
MAHSALEALSVTDGCATLLVVRERAAAGQPSSPRDLGPVRVDRHVYAQVVRECRRRPLQAVWIETAPGGVRIETGLGGVCPLYLAADGDGRHLFGSWELMDLRTLLSPGGLDEWELTRLLTGTVGYGHATLFARVRRLSERSTAHFREDGLSLLYPPPAAHALPTRITAGADVVAGFEALAAHVLSRRPLAGGLVAAHLSGGMDSTNLALTLAAAFPGSVTPCALLIDGPAGAQQSMRRRAIIDSSPFAFGADCVVAAAQHLPLHPDGRRRLAADRISPMEEPYVEAAHTLAGRLAERGITTVVTGFGGDEVFDSRPGDTVDTAAPPLPPWCGPHVRDLIGEARVTGTAPPTVAPETALDALSVATPLLARQGLWALAPFTDPDMVRFGERLPAEWKRDKLILRHRLACLGLPEDVVFPPLRENFGRLMNEAVHRHAVPLLRGWGEDLHLIEQGYLAPQPFAEAVERAAAGPEEAAPYRTVLYLVTAVELTLRAL